MKIKFSPIVPMTQQEKEQRQKILDEIFGKQDKGQSK